MQGIAPGGQELRDLTRSANQVPSTKWPELEELRRLTGASQAWVISEPLRRTRRVLAASPNQPLNKGGDATRICQEYQVLRWGGCTFALDVPPPNKTPKHSPVDGDLRKKRQLEHLLARTLGSMVLGSEDSVIYEVSDSSSKCLVLSADCSLQLVKAAVSAASSDRPVLITGETGVGKELIARLIHRFSGRRKFIPVSLAQVRGDTAVSELFGHFQGAFTGAVSRRRGAFVEAGDGTLFLDEIGDVQDHVAAALLRAIEEKSIKPLGSDTEINVPARIIAATNRPDQLRHDLFYRFTQRILVPPLRDRREDIRAIARYIAFREGFEISEKALTALPFLSAWQGNARELEYLLLQAADASHSPIVGLNQILGAMSSSVSARDGHDGNWLREIREALGLSLRELSDVVGIPKSTLADMEKENGVARRVELIETLIKYLDNQPVARAPNLRPRLGSCRVKQEIKRFLEEE